MKQLILVMAYSFKIKGIDKFHRELKAAQKKASQAVADEIEIVARTIQSDAKSLAPVEYSFLRNSINVEGSGLSWTVYANAFYAPYVEFGTGQFARNTVQALPGEWKEHAAEFYVNGNGHQPAQPFLYPAVRKAEETISVNIERVLQNELDKL